MKVEVKDTENQMERDYLYYKSQIDEIERYQNDSVCNYIAIFLPLSMSFSFWSSTTFYHPSLQVWSPLPSLWSVQMDSIWGVVVLSLISFDSHSSIVLSHFSIGIIFTFHFDFYFSWHFTRLPPYNIILCIHLDYVIHILFHLSILCYNWAYNQLFIFANNQFFNTNSSGKA